MKILIAPNSFKEAADSDEVCNLFLKYLSKNNSLSFETLPISDGGDGFLNTCRSVFGLKILKYKITTPFDESQFECNIGYNERTRQVFIESARILGLKVIPKEKRNPLYLSSKGIGDIFLKLIDEVERKKLAIEEVVIGVGGTGTNDLGLGVCSRFGLELYDIYGKKDKILPEYFYRVKTLKWEKSQLPFNIKNVIDVNNPLLGAKGATRIFGQQKGADKGEIEVMELGFHKILNLLKNSNLDISDKELSGAGGGLAAGLQIFFDAYVIKAHDFIINQLNLEEKIKEADIVLTGEGRFDEQTLEGKGAGIVLELATKLNKKVILCCGKVDNKVKVKLGNNIEIFEFISFFNSPEESINNFEKGVEQVCGNITSIL